MKVVVLNPWKVLLAGIISCLLVTASVLGALALWGVFQSEPAEAYGAYDPGVGARRWIFPEGYTGPGFEEWILLYNPATAVGGGGYTVLAEVRLYGNSGFIGFGTYHVEPGQRVTVFINDMAAYYGYSGDISVVVQTADVGGQPFVCERALYFNYKGQITGGSQTFGYQEGAVE